jgi:Fe-S cluster assembly protein SufD
VSSPVKIDLTDATTFPSRRVETWKYSDLARHLREAPAASPVAELEGEGPFATLNAEPMAFVNGKAVTAADRIVSGEQVLALRFVARAEGTGHAASARIVAQSGANLVLLESHEGQGADYVAHNRLELDIAADATVTRIVLVEDAADAISIVEADVNLAAGGRFRQTVLTTGAKLQRIETRLAHSANGADARLDGLYLLTGSRHADLTTVVDHLDADGTTSQLTKGVARETSRGVFQGKIIVERGADGTDARMAHNALIDGERAEIDAKPELIIYADDVQCAHGNTVGTLDETALFYMQARGITAEEARALLTEAFLNEVVDRIEQEDVREVVGQWLTERL